MAQNQAVQYGAGGLLILGRVYADDAGRSGAHDPGGAGAEFQHDSVGSGHGVCAVRVLAIGEDSAGVGALPARAARPVQLADSAVGDTGDDLYIRRDRADGVYAAARWGEHDHVFVFGESDDCDGAGDVAEFAGAVEDVYERRAGESDDGG